MEENDLVRDLQEVLALRGYLVAYPPNGEYDRPTHAAVYDLMDDLDTTRDECFCLEL